ncbi:MAG: DUF6702 family protein [Flavobacteriales bacterium]
MIFHAFLYLMMGMFPAETHHHDFHYSRTDIAWNAVERTFQMEIRVFTDDLEDALSRLSADPNPFRLGDPRERTDVPDLLQKWIDDNCILLANELGVSKLYLGKEVDYDISYLFVETQPLSTPDILNLKWTLFFDLFADQVNEITFNMNGSSQRILFTTEEPNQIVLP